MVDNPGNPMSGKKRGTSDLNGSANGAAQRRAKIRKIRFRLAQLGMACHRLGQHKNGRAERVAGPAGAIFSL